MTLPIVVLAIPSLLAGWACRHIFSQQVVLPVSEHGAAHVEHHVAWLPWLATAVALTGIALAWRAYASRGANVARALRSEDRPRWYRVVQDKFYIDEAWLFLARRVIFDRMAAPCKWVDRKVVDGGVDLSAFLTQFGGALVRAFQNGQLAFYIGIYLAGVLALCFFGHV